MQQTWSRGFTQAYFEGDCKILINNINNRLSDVSSVGLLLDIKFWATKFHGIRFDCINRSCNQVAHNLAQFGSVRSSFYFDGTNPPSWIVNELYNDLFN